MTLGVLESIRHSYLSAINTAINAGSGAGKLRIYNGSRPATGGTATTLLAELTFSDPAAPSPSGGVLTFSSITADSSADNTGTATWFRIVDSDNNFVLDGSVGTSGADINFNSVSFVAGGNVAVSSLTFTAGDA